MFKLLDFLVQGPKSIVFRGDCAYQFHESNSTAIGFSFMNSNSEPGPCEGLRLQGFLFPKPGLHFPPGKALEGSSVQGYLPQLSHLFLRQKMTKIVWYISAIERHWKGLLFSVTFHSLANSFYGKNYKKIVWYISATERQ
jgi:hypothetical protein